MKVIHLKNRPMSPKAAELFQFDMDSIRQIVASRHGRPPMLWVSDPDQYERNGRILRDSTTPRLLAYAPEDRKLYVTDGCNSCTHQLEGELTALTPEQMKSLADTSSIHLEMLECLAAG
jgi:hypothetical protein